MFLTFPLAIKSHEYCFKLNTDDYPVGSIGKITKHLKSKGVDYKKSIYYLRTKLMGYHVFKIRTDEPIKTYQENIDYCTSLFDDFKPKHEKSI